MYDLDSSSLMVRKYLRAWSVSPHYIFQKVNIPQADKNTDLKQRQ